MMEQGGPLEKATTIALIVSGDSAEYSQIPKRKITPYMATIQNIPPSLRYRLELPLALHHGEAKDDSVWRAIFNAMEENEGGRWSQLG